MEEKTNVTRRDTWNRSYEAAMKDYYTAGKGLFQVKQSDKDYISTRYMELLTEAANGVTDELQQDLQSLEQLAELCSCTDMLQKLRQIRYDQAGGNYHV